VQPTTTTHTLTFTEDDCLEELRALLMVMHPEWEISDYFLAGWMARRALLAARDHVDGLSDSRRSEVPF
jgi:hypothetical protein